MAAVPQGFPQPKPAWVRQAVLRLREETGFSHRKLADAFNQRHAASHGVSVGRTWVRELLKTHDHQALHRRHALKHRLPAPLPRNRVWGADTTCLATGNHLTALGIVDHGTRLAVMLHRLHCFNAWTLAGCVLLAVGQYGRPVALRLDNHPVHHARWFRRLMRWAGIRLQFTRPASPWQNGRIERFFGTLKTHLRDAALPGHPLDLALDAFRVWYNVARPHQHLGGRTPAQAWHGIDPFRQPPRGMSWFVAWDGRLSGWVLRH